MPKSACTPVLNSGHELLVCRRWRGAARVSNHEANAMNDLPINDVAELIGSHKVRGTANINLADGTGTFVPARSQQPGNGSIRAGDDSFLRARRGLFRDCVPGSLGERFLHSAQYRESAERIEGLE